jgi:hypothetical protein
VGLPRFDIFQTLTCVFPCIDTHFAMILLCNWLLISEIWNFANFFTEDVKKNLIFPQFFGYIAIYLVPDGGQLCFDDIVDSRHSEVGCTV